jgi:pilus assembly protein CpaB
LLKPNDAERAVLASAQGTVHFVLRNGSDRVQVTDQPAQLSQLSGKLQVAPAVAAAHKVVLVAAPKTYAVETISGGKQTVDTFQ